MSTKKAQGQTEFTAKENIWMTVKYLFFVSTAGIIQIALFNLLRMFVFKDNENPFGWSYFIATVVSIIWNYTINRRYTFKSTVDYKRVLLMALCYNAVFVPLSTFGGQALVAWLNIENELWENAVLIGIMMSNAVVEYIYQRLAIHKGAINTNELAQTNDDES
ncbi:MAG: GtrA family protein [Oscillospiraceae bacterium]|nr:GtrA family protein [Oscillospiraceae bacterium]